MDEYHSGISLAIWLAAGAEASWNEAEMNVRAAHRAQFRARMYRLAGTGWLRSPDYLNAEGNGIFALKGSSGLRAYGWFDQVHGRKAFIISHVTLKKRQKLDPADLARAIDRRNGFHRNRLRS